MEITTIKIIPDCAQEYETILNDDVKKFLFLLETEFGPQRINLLAARHKKQSAYDQGVLPDFLKETQSIRDGSWKAARIPEDLLDRRVEITGPVDRKMIINALNSGANVFMADFEDSNSPTWDNCMRGQLNLIDAVNKSISYKDAASGKQYQLREKTATLMVRPRGWHLEEAHVLVNGQAISASLFDFGLFFYHNAKKLLSQGSGPYFYLPKMESHLEARLWNQVFVFAQNYIGIPQGSIRATVLIETISAAFEMDEIIYELREHSAGLNCGRWDYIFSFIKKFRNRPDYVLPDRQEVTMTQHFLKSYVDLLIATCHKRGVHAMGGMAAQIPIRNNEKANEEAMKKVFADKKREVMAGHDGTWVAHPGLIPVALEAFNAHMNTANQIETARPTVHVSQQDLLTIPKGSITLNGIRNNISVGIQYLTAWLTGNGCVPINNLMEDAATAEICRAQLWQWLKFNASIDNGSTFEKNLFLEMADEEHKTLQQTGLPSEALDKATKLFTDMVCKPYFDEFLTLPAYEMLTAQKESTYE
ncbi:Malate synthase A [Legionella birminghamensis]|uniref:Malate synthase n=1 Tax=Legionella birminghamensis TaxID=28083 RepID=A0A378I837_9GAMM|nr:malate synthase A [Legionella birminghamensis]KTC71512.1 Malate synthase A [Legionella birminghamensis]STX30880.1 Malate synthase A [Legionella birminghamensis]